jgi:hypothetical protein
MSIEYFNDLIGNRTRHLPACRVVPQSNISPRTPNKELYMVKILIFRVSFNIEELHEGSVPVIKV